MAIAGGELVVALHASLEIVAPLLLLEIVGVDDLQRDRGHHAEHADGHLGGGHRLGVRVDVEIEDVAVGLDEAHADRLGREAAERDPGAVRAGRQRAGDRLRIDVALIGERQPHAFERAADVADPGSRAHGDALARQIGADDALHGFEAQQQAAGRHHRRERMAGAGDAHGQIRARRLGHHRRQFVLRSGLALMARDDRLIADPIAPVAARAEANGRRLRNFAHGRRRRKGG
jgi:hypothetical protein